MSEAIDQNVDMGKRFECRRGHCFGCAVLGQVDDDWKRSAALGLDVSCHLRRAFSIDVDDHDVGALGRVQGADRTADGAGSAGHDCHSVREQRSGPAPVIDGRVAGIAAIGWHLARRRHTCWLVGHVSPSVGCSPGSLSTTDVLQILFRSAKSRCGQWLLSRGPCRCIDHVHIEGLASKVVQLGR